MMINTPASAYVMNAPGPVSFMTTPEPTNRPAPITPPMAIIVSCRWLGAFFSVGAALMAFLRYSIRIIIAFLHRCCRIHPCNSRESRRRPRSKPHDGNGTRTHNELLHMSRVSASEAAQWKRLTTFDRKNPAKPTNHRFGHDRKSERG